MAFRRSTLCFPKNGQFLASLNFDLVKIYRNAHRKADTAWLQNYKGFLSLPMSTQSVQDEEGTPARARVPVSDPRTVEPRQEDFKFEVFLGYKLSSKIAWAA